MQIARRFIALVLALGGATACAALQPKAAQGTCVVEARYLIGGKVAHVTGDDARIPGLLGSRDIASRRGTELIWKAGVAELATGAFEHDRLVLKGLWKVSSEPIEGGKISVPLPIGAREFSYNGACSKPQAALGAYAILQMESEDAITSAAVGG